MTLEEIKNDIPDLINKLGETFYDATLEDDNTFDEVGKNILHVVAECKNDEEFFLVDKMLIATCGYCFETLIERIKERDSDNYCWNYA